MQPSRSCQRLVWLNLLSPSLLRLTLFFAGKTTLLRHILQNTELKIGCIVNDVASVNIDGSTGLLRGSGVLHWVVLTKISPERNGLGLVELYNPAMNRIECYSWQEFINSAHQPYGVYVPDPTL